MSNGDNYEGARGLILVPTPELCEQVKDHLKELCYYCSKEVSFIHLPSDVAIETQK
jgi:ATP-dependent RNA helicase DDX56/DBP9